MVKAPRCRIRTSHRTIECHGAAVAILHERERPVHASALGEVVDIADRELVAARIQGQCSLVARIGHAVLARLDGNVHAQQPALSLERQASIRTAASRPAPQTLVSCKEGCTGSSKLRTRHERVARRATHHVAPVQGRSPAKGSAHPASAVRSAAFARSRQATRTSLPHMPRGASRRLPWRNSAALFPPGHRQGSQRAAGRCSRNPYSNTLDCLVTLT